MNYPQAHNSLSRPFLRIFATRNSGVNLSLGGLITTMGSLQQISANYGLQADILSTGKLSILNKQIIIK